jgi:hypothetical protein
MGQCIHSEDHNSDLETGAPTVHKRWLRYMVKAKTKDTDNVKSHHMMSTSI